MPVSYQADRTDAERILINCAEEVTRDLTKVSEDVRQAMERKYFIDLNTLKPRVFLVLTDNWIELNLRFISRPHGARDVKDEISRKIIARFDEAKIGIASATYDVVGSPPLRVEGPAVDRIASALERGTSGLQKDARRSA